MTLEDRRLLVKLLEEYLEESNDEDVQTSCYDLLDDIDITNE